MALQHQNRKKASTKKKSSSRKTSSKSTAAAKKDTTTAKARAASKKRKKKKTRAELAKLQFRKGLRNTLYGATVITTIFTAIMVVAGLFLVYQWKEYKVTETVKETKVLQDRILRLQSENSRLKANINTRLKNNQRILKMTRERLGLDAARNRSVLRVDQKAFEYYVQKDQQEKEQNLQQNSIGETYSE
ncbi:MAG: hypothetical protein AAFP70_06640 [Calditrichota bacterium]